MLCYSGLHRVDKIHLLDTNKIIIPVMQKNCWCFWLIVVCIACMWRNVTFELQRLQFFVIVWNFTDLTWLIYPWHHHLLHVLHFDLTYHASWWILATRITCSICIWKKLSLCTKNLWKSMTTWSAYSFQRKEKVMH